MTKWLIGAALGVSGLALGMCSSSALAQAPFGRPPVNTISQPPLSPFLNLTRGGNPAINYYSLVRPQVDFAASLQQLQQGLYTQQPMGTGDAAAAVQSITGHPSQFMNFSHYYNYRIAGSAALRPAVVPPFTLPPAILPTANLTGVGVGFGR